MGNSWEIANILFLLSDFESFSSISFGKVEKSHGIIYFIPSHVQGSENQFLPELFLYQYNQF